MINELKVEQLNYSNRHELLDLFTYAFTGHHTLVPALSSKPNATRVVMKAFIRFFGGTTHSYLYGIRKNGRLLCGSVSVDSSSEPSFLALIRFIFSLTLALGWRSSKELELIHREEPKYGPRYLELVILGTLPSWQRKGLGRKMLWFLYNLTEELKYKGVILVADQNTPAFNLYLKEGFSINKKVKIRGRSLCWMRLSL